MSMKRKRTTQSAFFRLRGLLALLACAVAACSMVTGTLLAFLRPDVSAKISQRTLTFAERVSYQRAIEEVYWRHRIWPKEQSRAKAATRCRDFARAAGNESRRLSSQIAAGRGSTELANHCEQLQAEMERMASHTLHPRVLLRIVCSARQRSLCHRGMSGKTARGGAAR